ncbi:septum site-determining protein MinC [Plasticicumulans acidivorans]|uniref:Probable septum site-determining protein MinC n=1 Tax=Plasticicumulans acidivorans TaxID=886464 RepID=A0A317MTS3_9GAMM|nr:septum site-determining protein MinC [Plasticicumulans acidivorans]PWV60506.1 septum site-determining protein MinC [Plasticicumulans acidivorans]
MTSDRTLEAPFELKGSLFTLTVLRLHESDLAAIGAALDAKVAQAPGLFVHHPVVIDLDDLPVAAPPPDFAQLAAMLRQHGMVPVGVRHGSEAASSAAVAAGLALLPESRPAMRRSDVRDEESGVAAAEVLPATVQPTAVAHNRIIATQVRSGQQIYAADGDLTVLGAVSAGAEVLADGSIHVYGSLKGKALAGVKGNTAARIFCHGLEAELVSVAGRYRTIEKGDSEWEQAVQIYLAGENLIIEPLVLETSGHRKL